MDLADVWECTPLSKVVESGNEDIVRLLVEAGACPNPVLPNGLTLEYLRLAAERQNLEVVRYLLGYVDVASKIRRGLGCAFACGCSLWI